MKKFALFIVALLLIACSENDESTTQEQVELKVEHFKTTSDVYGTAFIVSEDGNTERIKAQIDNFFFEPGFIYQLSANKITTENAGTNSRTVRYRAITVNSREVVRPDIEFRMYCLPKW